MWFKTQIKFQNGEAYIEFSLFCDRITSEVSEVFELVKYIEERAHQFAERVEYVE